MPSGCGLVASCLASSALPTGRKLGLGVGSGSRKHLGPRPRDQFDRLLASSSSVLSGPNWLVWGFALDTDCWLQLLATPLIPPLHAISTEVQRGQSRDPGSFRDTAGQDAGPAGELHDIFNILQGMGGAWPQVCGGDGGSGGMGCWVFSSFWGLNNVIYCAVLLTNRTQDQFRKCEKSIAKCKEN